MMKFQDFPNRLIPMNRRSFLVLSGILGVGAASTGVFVSESEAAKFDRNRHNISKTLPKMGTFVSMTLIHSSKDKAEEAMGQAFAEIDRLERIFNRFDQSAAVASLNTDGHIKAMPPELSEVIARAIHYHETSRGTFDITVKPVVDLFQEKMGGNQKRMPSEKELRAVLRLVDAKKIRLNNGNLRFMQPGMGITLDGIAKGYIVDKASEVLAAQGIDDHLINAGGDIRTRGEKPGKLPWTVAIQDPAKKNDYPDIIHMRDGAVATSGNYEIFYDKEKMFHHIVDPNSGLSPLLASSVSVMAQTTMDADALSTSAFVMNPEQGMVFIEQLPNCDCLIVTRDNNQLRSKGWKSTAA